MLYKYAERCLISKILLDIWIWISFILQNPENKREIILDDKLKSIFGNKDKIGMLEIGKLISPHFIKSS